MPVSILDLQQRLRRVGKLRMGHKVPMANNKTRPDKLEKWRLTSTDRSALEHVAKMYGGTVTPWEGEPGQYELYTDAVEILIKLWPTDVKLANEYWSAAGRQRSCAGPGGKCRKVEVVNGEAVEVEAPCFCESLPTKEQCKLTLRLDFQLAGVPVLGTWGLESHGVFAATELPMQVHHLTTMYPHGALCIIAIEPREVKEQGKPTKNFCVPVIRVREGMAEELAARGGRDVAALIASGPIPQSLPAPAAANELPRNVDQETGEVIESPVESPGLTVQQALDTASAFIRSCECTVGQVAEFKRLCEEKKLKWVNQALSAQSEGVTSAQGLIDYITGKPAKVSA